MLITVSLPRGKLIVNGDNGNLRRNIGASNLQSGRLDLPPPQAFLMFSFLS